MESAQTCHEYIYMVAAMTGSLMWPYIYGRCVQKVKTGNKEQDWMQQVLTAVLSPPIAADHYLVEENYTRVLS